MKIRREFAGRFNAMRRRAYSALVEVED